MAPKKASTKTTKKETPAPVVEAPAPEPVKTPASTFASSDAAMEHALELLNEYDTKVRDLKALSVEVRKTLRSYSKLTKDEVKAVSKGKRVKKARDPNAPKRAPSGFAKPTNLSPELCKFLGVPANTQVARTDVTKKVTEYIKTHNLQNPDNKREILLDGPLKALLAPPPDTSVTFFSLQTHMKKHFVGSTPAAPVEEPVTKKAVPLKKKAKASA